MAARALRCSCGGDWRPSTGISLRQFPKPLRGRGAGTHGGLSDKSVAGVVGPGGHLGRVLALGVVAGPIVHLIVSAGAAGAAAHGRGRAVPRIQWGIVRLLVVAAREHVGSDLLEGGVMVVKRRGRGRRRIVVLIVCHGYRVWALAFPFSFFRFEGLVYIL